jgi:hypothetical protein
MNRYGKNQVPSKEIHFTSSRPLDDFFRLDNRWSFPDFNDIPRVKHRLFNNLIYYQTNYFILTIVFYILTG